MLVKWSVLRIDNIYWLSKLLLGQTTENLSSNASHWLSQKLASSGLFIVITRIKFVVCLYKQQVHYCSNICGRKIQYIMNIQYIAEFIWSHT